MLHISLLHVAMKLTEEAIAIKGLYPALLEVSGEKKKINLIDFTWINLRIYKEMTGTCFGNMATKL